MSGTSVPRNYNDFGEDDNVEKSDGQFTFSNGDVYVGGYMIVKDKRFLSRQGQGIYVTGDFNKYETHWVEDQIFGEINICHNNGTRYEGKLGNDGGMFGFGTYTFIDNSVLEATWEKNQPVADIILKENLGSIWKGVCDGKEITFFSGNHFWDEISPKIINDAEQGEDENNQDIDPDNLSPNLSVVIN